ncbi:restriction endonuclease subunit S [Kocuria marina]|uniref:Type I restriction modification DNA specificity domain-containing protein n=1 Tax=Kocuria marina subsp. indica TaxID=1049583 RepID=A0A1X7CDB8_9MICC|nr:restriction endonuclease subunit S [Kocuria indica]OXS85518.1 hypothetical protein B1B07_02680 [Kocuria indica]RLP58955.1 restriction endonuclease subunit S [Kocuria indica]SME94569.1 Type I restriction modification DNA specificity domain-containing protein [Kocuria indica]
MNRQVLTIEDVCLRVTSGGTPSRRVSAFFKGDIPWLKTQELRDTWVYETEEHITRDAVNQSSAKLLPAHSVMMAMYGATAGKLAILGSEMTCNQAACAMVVDPDKADYRYLYYSLLNDRARIVDRANGAAQQNLSARAIKALEYSFPPIEEQRVIAATLGALDDKIESNRRASKLAQELLRARFRAWFTEYLPWGGKRPVDWREGKLRDVVDLVRTPTKPGCYPQRPYVPIDTIPMDSLGLSHSRDNSEAKSSLFTFEADDILLGAMRVYFHRVALAPYAGITRNTTFVLRPKSALQDPGCSRGLNPPVSRSDLAM